MQVNRSHGLFGEVLITLNIFENLTIYEEKMKRFLKNITIFFKSGQTVGFAKIIISDDDIPEEKEYLFLKILEVKLLSLNESQ